MPRGARSTASARARPTSPAFAAAYAGLARIAITGPVTLATITTRRWSASSGKAARVVT